MGLERYLDTTVPDMMGKVWDRRRARLNFPYLDGRLAVHTEAGEEAMQRLCGAGQHVDSSHIAVVLGGRQ